VKTLFIFVLNVVQSAAVKTPRLVADADGKLIVIVPDVVIGDPATLTSVPVDPVAIATDVTDPVATFAHDKTDPLVVKNRPALPVCVGKLVTNVYASFQLDCEIVVGMAYPAAYEIAIVPVDVIGDPETANPVGTETATDVTAGMFTFTQFVPLYCNN
jgi:hypothetical protein